jgi:cell division transport system permease protein
MAAAWRADLQNTMTVQITPGIGIERDVTAKKAKMALLQNSKVSTVDILDDAYSRALLDPWIGNTPLPSGINLPIMLSIELEPGQKPDIQPIISSLANQNIDAVIDDHQGWNAQFKRSILALQSLSLLALLLVALAILAAVIFATRSVLNGRRMLIDVLHQIGAAPNYTARLFSTRFALTGLKAGATGALGAVFVLLIAGVMAAGTAGSIQFFPRITSGPSYLILAALVPVFVAAICAITAWRTVLKTLYNEVYP